MPRQSTARYCADPEALNAMRRDGMGWGHDLDCGCFHDTARTTKPNPLARLMAAINRRT